MSISKRRIKLALVGPRPVHVLVLAAIYFAAAKLSLSLAIPPGYATPIWPPSGIALAALLLAGMRMWPGVWVGAALVNLTVQGSPLLAVLIATGNTLEAVIAASLIVRSGGHHGRFETPEDVIKFVAISTLSAAIAALIGAGSLAVLGIVPTSDFALNALTWWQGDTTAMIVVTPFIISWALTPLPAWPRRRVIEALVLASVFVVTAYFTFSGATLPLAFAMLPFILWAAIRFGQREVMTVIALICVLAIWYAARQRGPFGLESPHLSALILLAYASTLAITGLILSTVIEVRDRRIAAHTRALEAANASLRDELAERRRKEEVLHQSEQRFRTLVDGVSDYAIYMLDPNGRIVSWNAGAERIKGYNAAEIVGEHVSRFYVPEDLARGWPVYSLEQARKNGRFEDEGLRVRKDGSRFRANTITSAIYDSERHLLGFAKVTRDLTERQRIEALQEDERRIREFLAMLAHELRNPLAPIVNALTLIRAAPASEHKDLYSMISRQVAHLSRIVDDLLEVSRITRGKIVLRREIVDVNAIAEHAYESCRPVLEGRRHDVDLRLAPERLLVDADPVRLGQLLINLLNNAAKYTPEGGFITLTTCLEKDEVVIRVRDSGIGISATMLPKVFDLFVQADRSLDRTEGGLGIGLTLVKRIAEMHDGSVAVRSDGPGQGSEFTVRLPRAGAQSCARPTPPQSNTLRGGQRRHIVVVDDNRDYADTTATMLEALGHDVRKAYDGPAALSLVQEYKPDVILLDIGLPGMNGYEVARRMRDVGGLESATLVAVSGYGQEDDKRQVEEAGFNHHLVKPVDPAALFAIIDAPAKRI